MSSSGDNTNKGRTGGYHEHIPADVIAHVDKAEWGHIELNTFVFHEINEGVTAPTIPDYTVGYVTAGCVHNGYYRFDSNAFRVTTKRRGDAVLVNRDTPLTWKWAERFDENPPLQAVVIHLDADLFRDTATKCFDQPLGSCEMINQVTHDDPVIGELALALQAEATGEHSPFGHMYRESCAQLLAVHLLKNYFSRTFKSGFGSQTLQRRPLNRVVEYINDHLGANISLGALAELAGINKYHLIREFKRLTGFSPHQYVIKRRIEEACRLLEITDWSITRVALEVGYENHGHFSQIFKKAVGCSPREYRGRIA